MLACAPAALTAAQELLSASEPAPTGFRAGTAARRLLSGLVECGLQPLAEARCSPPPHPSQRLYGRADHPPRFRRIACAAAWKENRLFDPGRKSQAGRRTCHPPAT